MNYDFYFEELEKPGTQSGGRVFVGRIQAADFDYEEYDDCSCEFEVPGELLDGGEQSERDFLMGYYYLEEMKHDSRKEEEGIEHLSLWMRRMEQDPFAEGFVHVRYADGTRGGFEWDCKLDLEGAGRIAQAWTVRHNLLAQAGQDETPIRKSPKI